MLDIPYYTDPRATLWQGDCRAVLRSLPPKSVHCVVTSPPYLGLRAYAGEQEQVWGGDLEHAHEWEDRHRYWDNRHASLLAAGEEDHLGGKGDKRGGIKTGYCRCGAMRCALGLEPTIREYVCHLLEVMREVGRVLRDDGTLWLNIGDSYAGSWGAQGHKETPKQVGRNSIRNMPKFAAFTGSNGGDHPPEKNLMLIPERLALALQDDGWICRSRIAWCKTSAMPESVTDRPSSAWEHIFLFAKQGNYYFDQEAVRSVHTREWWRETVTLSGTKIVPDRQDGGNRQGNGNPAGANLRNFWLLGPEPFAAAHFATFPTEIPRRAILAGTSARGCCSACGAPWRRVVERERQREGASPVLAGRDTQRSGNTAIVSLPAHLRTDASRSGMGTPRIETTGWQPTCAHEAPVVPATVFDPFAGSGTTLAVARALGRIGWGAELSAEYCRMAVKRIQGQTPAMALDA